jgi:membrane dipeptidase
MFIIVLSIYLPIASRASNLEDPEYRLAVVTQLLKETPLIDGHNDLPWNIRQFVHNKIKTVNFSSDLSQVSPWSSSKWSHTDISRLVKGKVGAQLWVAYSPCGSQHKDAVQITLEQIDLIKRLMADYSARLQLVTTADGDPPGPPLPPLTRPGGGAPVREDRRRHHRRVRPLHRHLPLRPQDVPPAWGQVTGSHPQL